MSLPFGTKRLTVKDISCVTGRRGSMEHATDSHGSMNELTVAPQHILSAGATKILFYDCRYIPEGVAVVSMSQHS